MDIPEQISSSDRALLRELAEQQASIAAQPRQAQMVAEWRRLNGLEPGRPLVWVNDVPWSEMDVDGELALRAEDEWCQRLEAALRQTLYGWKHMRGDMVVEEALHSPLVIEDTGFGLTEKIDMDLAADGTEYSTWQYHPQIDSEADLEGIESPTVTHLEEQSQAQFERVSDLMGDILPVGRRGIAHVWFAPWEQLSHWWNPEKALLDLAWRPELVNAAMERLVGAHRSRLAQWESLGLLAYGGGNYPVGSGGPGYTDELPQAEANAGPVRPCDQWGCASAGILSSVSPTMHEQFSLQHERQWLDQFGLTYYGDYEPLHHKLGILESIPNLRKVSMSPGADIGVAAWQMAGKYVLSLKPDPGPLGADTWDLAAAREDLQERLRQCEGCVVEIVLGDITTVGNEPQRLWEWVDMAMELAAKA